jgi:hypothetical protein
MFFLQSKKELLMWKYLVDSSDFPQSLQADIGVVAQIMPFSQVVVHDISVKLSLFCNLCGPTLLLKR